jgi:hypothetical protein
LLLALLAVCQAVYARAAEPATAGLARLADKYGVQVVVDKEPFPVKTAHGAIDGKAASREELRAYVPLLLFEFNLYPRDLVKKTELKRIVLCKDLTFGGQRRNAVPDFEHNTLYLEVARGRHSGPYMRRVIHHEFFHIIDLRDDGELYRDERWAALNGKGFRYGAGGKEAQGDATVSLAGGAAPGFVNRYSMTAVEEDKAEVFAHMMVGYDQLEKRATRDRVLGLKVRRMAGLLERFSPAVDRGFWQRVRRLRRQMS